MLRQPQKNRSYLNPRLSHPPLKSVKSMAVLPFGRQAKLSNMFKTESLKMHDEQEKKYIESLKFLPDIQCCGYSRHDHLDTEKVQPIIHVYCKYRTMY